MFFQTTDERKSGKQGDDTRQKKNACICALMGVVEDLVVQHQLHLSDLGSSLVNCLILLRRDVSLHEICVAFFFFWRKPKTWIGGAIAMPTTKSSWLIIKEIASQR